MPYNRVVGRWNHSPRGIAKSQNVATCSSGGSHVEAWSFLLCALLWKYLFVPLQNDHCGNNYFARFYSLTDSVFRWLPIVFNDFKRRTAGWHFVDLWTETFKIAAGRKKETFQIKHWFFSIIYWYYTFDHNCLKFPVLKCSIFLHKGTLGNLRCLLNCFLTLNHIQQSLWVILSFYNKGVWVLHFTSLSRRFHFSLVRFMF